MKTPLALLLFSHLHYLDLPVIIFWSCPKCVVIRTFNFVCILWWMAFIHFCWLFLFIALTNNIRSKTTPWILYFMSPCFVFTSDYPEDVVMLACIDNNGVLCRSAIWLIILLTTSRPVIQMYVFKTHWWQHWDLFSAMLMSCYIRSGHIHSRNDVFLTVNPQRSPHCSYHQGSCCY